MYTGAYCLGTVPKRTAKYIRSIFKKTRGSTVNIVLRGRGSRKEHGDSQDLPLKYAEQVAVYVRPKQITGSSPY